MSQSGLSRAGLARLHDRMAGYVESGEIPGLVALVSRRGEVFVEALGAQSAGGVPIRRDTIFRISSMTKPVTAVAAMILVEECRLRLDDPVEGFLPELSGRKVLKRLDGPLDETEPACRSITLRDLLTFQMGFGQIMASPEAVPIFKAAVDLQIGMGPPNPQKMPGPDEWIRRLGSLPLMHQPGEMWLYNTGLDVLGVLIARAAGQPLETFLRERIFEPLDMQDTAFSVPPAKLERLATEYWLNPLNGKLEVFDEAAGGQWSRPPIFPSGAAGLVSTIDDYLAFGQMLLNQGKLGSVRVLSRPAVEVMTSDHLTPAQKAVSGLVPGFFDSHGWGFGLSVVTRRENLGMGPGSFGWDGGLGTSWYADPQEEMQTILMTQKAWTSANPPKVCRDFWTSAYAAIED